MYYLTLKKHDCTLAQGILNWNTAVAGHNQVTVAFLQRKPLPRSTADSTVSSCTFLCQVRTERFLSKDVLCIVLERCLLAANAVTSGNIKHSVPNMGVSQYRKPGLAGN